jgi:hypothetical protein
VPDLYDLPERDDELRASLAHAIADPVVELFRKRRPLAKVAWVNLARHSPADSYPIDAPATPSEYR